MTQLFTPDIRTVPEYTRAESPVRSSLAARKRGGAHESQPQQDCHTPEIAPVVFGSCLTTSPIFASFPRDGHGHGSRFWLELLFTCRARDPDELDTDQRRADVGSTHTLGCQYTSTATSTSVTFGAAGDIRRLYDSRVPERSVQTAMRRKGQTCVRDAAEVQ